MKVNQQGSTPTNAIKLPKGVYMRFALEFKLKHKVIPIDYRRKFISFLKRCFEIYDKTVFDKFYKDRDNIDKPYTFSVYLGRAKFQREIIELQNDIIFLNFSTADNEAGLYFYNAVSAMVGKEFAFGRENRMTLKTVKLNSEKNVISDSLVFKTLSPVLIREHLSETNDDNYLSFEEDEVNNFQILKNNLKYQITSYFGEQAESDADEIKVEIENIKKIIVSNYSIKIPANIGRFKVTAKSYILDYLYKAGMGSKKSAGFGMLDVVE